MRLAENLDLKAAEPLTAELLAARGQDLTLDASGVRRVGGLCLQVLLAAQHIWAAEGRAFRISDPSLEFQDGLTLMGGAVLTSAAPAAKD